MATKTITVTENGFEEYISRPLIVGDIGAYKIVLKTEYDLTNCSVRITAKRADGVILEDTGTVSGNNAEYTIKSSIYSVEGDVEIRIIIGDSDGNCLTDKSLIFTVLSNHSTGDMQQADDDGHSVADLALAHMANRENPHSVTAAQLGLSNVFADLEGKIGYEVVTTLPAAGRECANKLYLVYRRSADYNPPDNETWAYDVYICAGSYTASDCYRWTKISVGDIDTLPTSSSTNVVTSGGVYFALSSKANTSHTHTSANISDKSTSITSGDTKVPTGGAVYTALANKMNAMTVDSTPTVNSTNLVTSGGVYKAVNGIYTTAGTSTALTVSIPSISTITAGLKITIIPHIDLWAGTLPTLSVNGSGATAIVRYYTDSNTNTRYATIPNLYSGRPINMMYDGSYWRLLHHEKAVMTDVDGVLSVANGGTGANTAAAALANLGATPNKPASNTAYDTGRVWLDGSAIYRKDFFVKFTGLTPNTEVCPLITDLGFSGDTNQLVVGSNLIGYGGEITKGIFYDGGFIFEMCPVSVGMYVYGYIEYINGAVDVDTYTTKTTNY